MNEPREIVWGLDREATRLGIAPEERREALRIGDDYGRLPSRESEIAFAVDGVGIVSEPDYYARLAHPDCPVCAELYAEGFEHARHGFAPSPYWEGGLRQARGRVERAGFDKYREVRGLVAWDDQWAIEEAERRRLIAQRHADYIEEMERREALKETA